MLPTTLKQDLREHLKTVKQLHDRDLQEGFGDVELPYALARKYPHAGREWGWQFVFPAAERSRDPRSGAVRRHHLHERRLQRAFTTRPGGPAVPSSKTRCFLPGWGWSGGSEAALRRGARFRPPPSFSPGKLWSRSGNSQGAPEVAELLASIPRYPRKIWRSSEIPENLGKLPRTPDSVQRFPENPGALRESPQPLESFRSRSENVGETWEVAAGFREIPRLSGKFRDSPENSEALRKIPEPTGTFRRSPEVSGGLRKTSEAFGNFPAELGIFPGTSGNSGASWKLSGVPRKFSGEPSPAFTEAPIPGVSRGNQRAKGLQAYDLPRNPTSSSRSAVVAVSDSGDSATSATVSH